ncbi:MAG: hypothetical protein AAF411_10865 [Myxococcota bacterium]
MKRGGRCWLVIVAALLACGDDDGPGTDGGVDADVDVDAAIALPEVAEAAAPQRPTIDCPPGWFSLEEEGDPFGVECEQTAFQEASCGGASAAFAGGAGECDPVGRLCTAPFPDRPSSTFVQAGGDGDGTREAPFGDLEAALRAAESGGTVFVEPGDYTISDTVGLEGVSIYGRCASDVRITGPEFDPTFEVRGESTLEGLTILNADIAIRVAEGGDARVERTLIQDPFRAALVIAVGGRARVERAIFRSQGEVIDEPHVGALIAGELQAKLLVVRGFADRQLQVRGETATADVEDSIFGTFRTDDGFISGGPGVRIEEGAQTTMRRVESSNAIGTCFTISDAGTEFECDNCTAAFASDPTPVGVLVREGATAILRQASLFGSTVNASVRSPGSRLRLEDSELLFAAADDEEAGFGALSTLGGELELVRVESVGSLFNEVRVQREGSARLEDVVLRETENANDEAITLAALRVEAGARVTFERVEVRGADDVGVRVTQSQLQGEDLRLIGMGFDPVTGFGGGLLVDRGSAVDLERVHIEDASYIGALFDGELDANVRDLRVLRTQPSACVDRRCRSFLGGIGVGAYGGARVQLSGAIIDGARSYGLQLARGSGEDATLPEVTFERSAIVNSAVGVHAPEEIALEPMLDGLQLGNNEVDVDRAERPIAEVP